VLEKDREDELDLSCEMGSITMSQGISCVQKHEVAVWIGLVLRRNRHVKPVIKRDIERTVRRGRRHEQLLDDLKEKRMY
jgi:hypothetical protein